MKRYALLALALILSCSMLTGCRRRESDSVMTTPSTLATRPATEPTTHPATEPMTQRPTEPGDHAVVEPTTEPATDNASTPSSAATEPKARDMLPETNMR